MISILCLLSFGCSALAQEMGSLEEGQKIARETCSVCHAVEDGEYFSPNLDAPAFEEIAHTRGMTATALSVWFKSPHPTMPNFIISADETDSLTVYILNLRNE